MRRTLLRDTRGATAIEFVLLAPAILTLLMGLMEISYQVSVRALLHGAVIKAGRDSAIEGNGTAAQTAALDDTVRRMVQIMAPNATFASTRTNFDNYSSIAGEPFTDSKFPNDATGTFDGVCNRGEPYTDVNGNGRYDLDLSSSGQGGANEVTKYTVTITYKRLFPIVFFKWTDTVKLTASTILKNQPYATQNVNGGTTVGKCA